MFSKIEFNVNDIHPAIRHIISAEVDRLNKTYPPFHGRVCIRVTEKIAQCECGKCNPQEIPGYAVTLMNSITDVCEIHLKAAWFGPNGDVGKLKRSLIEDQEHNFHGAMTNPAFIVAHEYGHIVDHMLHQVFGFDEADEIEEGLPGNLLEKAERDGLISNAIQKPWLQLMQVGAESAATPGRIIAAILGERFALVEPSDGKLVSEYAYKSPDEFFAETFAATEYGNKAQKALPTVGMMNDLMKITYEEVHKIQKGSAH